MKGSIHKTAKWTRKMDDYYEKVSKKQIAQDLSKSGFKVTPKAK